MCLNDWSSLLDQKHGVDVVYLDVAKAFDTVSHPKLLRKLGAYGVTGMTLQWLESFLSNRTLSVRVDEVLSSAL